MLPSAASSFLYSPCSLKRPIYRTALDSRDFCQIVSTLSVACKGGAEGDRVNSTPWPLLLSQLWRSSDLCQAYKSPLIVDGVEGVGEGSPREVSCPKKASLSQRQVLHACVADLMSASVLGTSNYVRRRTPYLGGKGSEDSGLSQGTNETSLYKLLVSENRRNLTLLCMHQNWI